MTALDCIEGRGDELDIIPQSLLLAADEPGFKHVDRVRSCVPADVMAEIANITWDIGRAGHVWDRLRAKLEHGVDRRLDRILSGEKGKEGD